MAWSILFVAGLLEITWAIGLKYTEGFSRLVPSVVTLAAMAGSVILLGLALKSLPVGTAYAVWTGIGAVGTATLGMILFRRARHRLPPRQHRADRCRHRRAEARYLKSWTAHQVSAATIAEAGIVITQA
ncbi:multidrug transporter EmrE-like cation transporter [Bradyrhizobium sp. USDA 4486]